ncbi:hypothetical protein BJX63DRAFT_431273 [Aspergillus granulosus]|uniref:Uncharacterized protein n=1 Tax=Aspergillus granulosus TaxID=176169 RepID=A0ABR4HHJ7_9EURO
MMHENDSLWKRSSGPISGFDKPLPPWVCFLSELYDIHPDATLQRLAGTLSPAVLTDLTEIVYDAAYLLRAPTANTTKALPAIASNLLKPDIASGIPVFYLATFLRDSRGVYTAVDNTPSILSDIGILPETVKSVIHIQPYITPVGVPSITTRDHRPWILEKERPTP